MNLLSKWPSYKTCRFDNVQNMVNVMIFQLISIFPSAHPLTVVYFHQVTLTIPFGMTYWSLRNLLKTEMSKGLKDLKGEC